MGKVSKEAATVITAKTRFPPTRKPRVLNKRAEALHALHVGHIVNAWNCAHAALYDLFRIIGAQGDYDLAFALWHTVQSDKTQREMLEAAVGADRKLSASHRSAILWAINVLTGLAAHRNDAAHTEMVFYYELTMPGIATKRATHERLAARPLEKYWRQLRGDLHGIANYLTLIAFSLQRGFARPLSRRPPLLFARSSDAPSQAKRRRAKAAARERQRQSSRK